MDNPGLMDHCHTLNEISSPDMMYGLADTPNKAAANCRREKGAGAAAAMIRRVVASRQQED
jgi:hypothetical protein